MAYTKQAIQRIRRWIREELQHPKDEGAGRNNQMIKVMPLMLEIGWTEDEVFDAFKRAYKLGGDTSKDDEIRGVLANAAGYVRERAGEEMASSQERTCRRREIERASARKLERVLDRYPVSFDELTTAGWRHLPRSLQRRRFIERMFQPEEVIWSGGKFDSGEPRHSSRFRPASQWAQSAIGWPFVSHCTFREGAFSRSNESVVARKYLVVESDSLATEEILAVFRWFEVEQAMKLRAAVFSGNRSIHGWFDWPTENDPREIAALLSGFRCDPATTRASQPVRLPGSIRSETGRLQELLYLDAPFSSVKSPKRTAPRIQGRCSRSASE